MNAASVALLVALVGTATSANAQTQTQSRGRCTVPEFLSIVSTLSADSMDGREAGFSGGQRAAEFILTEFRKSGMASPQSGWLQQVPLRYNRTMTPSIVVLAGGELSIHGDEDVIIQSEDTAVSAVGLGELVFVGFGIHAPDVGRDDFAGVSLNGRVVIIRTGAPDSSQLKLPWGRNDVRSTDAYKLSIARSKGALGVMFLNARRSRPSWTGVKTLYGPGALGMIAWLGDTTTARLTTLIGLDLNASRPTIPLTRSPRPPQVRFEIHQEVGEATSPNVIGVVRGRDPRAGAIVLTAHYDHLGTTEVASANQTVYHGALDNASGVAALICLARRFATEPDSLPRSLVFVATTAEETQGHFGAAWYASHPVAPLKETAAVINIDGMNTLAPTEDFFVLPGAFVDGGGLFEKAGRAVGMTLSTASFERGMDWSFDTEAFNRRGVPAVTVWQGFRARGLTPQEFFRISRERNSAYHTPGDTVSSSWNGDAIQQHLDLLHRVALELANTTRPVRLEPNSPYSLWPPAPLE